ncbi:PREDICTED: uncharacterized protein LOC106806646 isoform X2 [Priapulus caudatus]|uniref:Uncharacterized protein LOC106806646 isoform X1 n=1 Tax=Priapulus caudatus TaxID=37621 RepID=A0ABM1DW14_PRICU|nr:PREDICTED: uncharacterized protein LOC106806646 isoform X1 [Priapulus caudatus]XP_014664135.1 PREDICTED: uncharacterized protein LOC106806646 isoform X2 [Priapulus caudatus]
MHTWIVYALGISILATQICTNEGVARTSRVTLSLTDVTAADIPAGTVQVLNVYPQMAYVVNCHMHCTRDDECVYSGWNSVTTACTTYKAYVDEAATVDPANNYVKVDLLTSGKILPL